MASIFAPGFREKKKKTSPGRQNFHKVAPYCQIAVLAFSNIFTLCMLGMLKKRRRRIKNFTCTGAAKFSLGEGIKSTGSGSTGSAVSEGC